MDQAQPRGAPIRRKFMRAPPDRLKGRRIPSLWRNDLARAKPRQTRPHQLRRGFLEHHPARRNIHRRKANRAAQLAERRQDIGPARLEQGLLGQRARRHKADNRARHQGLTPAALFGLLGRFGLLGNRHTATRLDQPREIAFRRMDRHAAHRDRRIAVAAARGKRDIEDLRGRLRIIKEQLEKVAHPVKQQAFPRLSLQREILLHHRRHGHRRCVLSHGICTSRSVARDKWLAPILSPVAWV